MAIYYFNASVISRSAGRSATASAAYRAAEKIKDSRTGEVHDYSQKKGVDNKFILAPEQAAFWVYDRQKLWNEVERVEHRINSQLAREIQLAIPRELNRTEQVQLVKEYVSDLFVKEGMIADVTFHELDSHNPHAHIMLTMREIDEHGFKKNKNRDWNKRELLEKQRAAWSSYANHALEKAGINERIDHRTLAEQGINRIPQIHLGSAVTAMMKRGVPTDKGDRWEAIAEANKQIESLERSLFKVEAEINTEKKLNTNTSQGQISEVRMSSGVSSSIRLNFDEEEADLELPQVPSFSGRNNRQPEPKPVDRARTKYKNSVKLIHQELGENISDSRLDLEIYLRSNSSLEMIEQSSAYQSFEKADPKVAECYLKAIAYVAGTYQRLSKKKTPDLDKWAKNLVNVHLAKFYAKENGQSQNLEQQQTRRRGLHL
ncbi:MAG: MobQ family relaxase [Xenococcaceae cyanobacterium MO_188.B19]|nr:MobQ family relaxase [Xenococcaceae cyanobacterium MO_188.B19]